MRWLDGPRRAFTVNIAQPASVPNGNDVKPRNVNYVYGGPTNPVSPDPEQVTALTNVADSTPYATFAYDAAGNQTQRVIGDVAWLYLYDGEDRLRRVTKKSATTPMLVYSIEEYWYDENGSRIGVLKRDGAGVAQELIWFIGDTQAHYTAAGVVSKVLSHLSLGTPVARVERTGNTTTAIEYQFHGMASNTIAAVAADGTVNANVVYAPYGEVLEAQEAGGSVFGLAGHRRRFNDKYVDEIGGLGYYGARYYDNVLIGWTQADPKYQVAPDAAWSEPRRAMLYRFTGNNPLRYIDPDGLDEKFFDVVVRAYGSGPDLEEATNIAIEEAGSTLRSQDDGELGTALSAAAKASGKLLRVRYITDEMRRQRGDDYGSKFEADLTIVIVDGGNKKAVARADSEAIGIHAEGDKFARLFAGLVAPNIKLRDKPGVGGISTTGSRVAILLTNRLRENPGYMRDLAHYHTVHEGGHAMGICHTVEMGCTMTHYLGDNMFSDVVPAGAWKGGRWTDADTSIFGKEVSRPVGGCHAGFCN